MATARLGDADDTSNPPNHPQPHPQPQPHSFPRRLPPSTHPPPLPHRHLHPPHILFLTSFSAILRSPGTVPAYVQVVAIPVHRIPGACQGGGPCSLPKHEALINNFVDSGHTLSVSVLHPWLMSSLALWGFAKPSDATGAIESLAWYSFSLEPQSQSPFRGNVHSAARSLTSRRKAWSSSHP